jgi:hypothetical protein
VGQLAPEIKCTPFSTPCHSLSLPVQFKTYVR